MIDKNFRKDDLIEIIGHYGEDKQKLMVVEECSELIKEISKNFRYNNNRGEILYEIADVAVMLNQLMIIYGFTEKELIEIMNYKIDRTLSGMSKV